ncbi:hypothetical protein DERF_011117 [Dermatophagoides farinae]|uniref:Uncharacterized protein n=1 Tax=Dermatophagoides farinae TaxID=6954 RepID=A0A922L4H0_DERFA|nr:hypothetical protein DERF_011117 [Dermatophagoides farinae]
MFIMNLSLHYYHCCYDMNDWVAAATAAETVRVKRNNNPLHIARLIFEKRNLYVFWYFGAGQSIYGWNRYVYV